MKKLFTSLLCVAMFSSSFAQWSRTTMHGNNKRQAVNAKEYYALDLSQVRSKLSNAQELGKNSNPVEISLPTLSGKMETFKVYSFPVMDKALASQYQLGSYYGVSKIDPTVTVRFSVAPNDFQSMIFRNGATEFIEPMNADKSVYAVFPKTKKAANAGFFCSMNENQLSKEQMDQLYTSGQQYVNSPAFNLKSSDKKYRTMRLALSVTGEYTQYFGGVAGALTQMNATMTRVNGVMEKDLGLHLNMINNTTLIYTDPNTDPYSPSTSMSNWNSELQSTLTSVVGAANYDIGHLFGASGGGGNAGCIGCVCVDSSKGSGITSPADGIPMGDNFDIDYVIHEMGHQLGGNHSFSMSLEGTGVNAEPGSGSTIMGYAGITGATDVQPHSDALFHTLNISQIQTNLALATKTCDVETAVTNNPPVVAALTNYTIPKSTAFVLTGSATDAEGDPLTYIWEQVNSATTATTSTNLGTLTNGPNFRVWTPTTTPTRYFPKLSTVLAGSLKSTTDWEAVSTVARTMNFRLTVRDNNADVTQQQTQFATQTITVGADGPFKVTSTKVYNNAAGPLTWDVVNTAAAPYNVANVKIDYTTNNGTTWTELAASTPNDGTEDFSFPSLATGTSLKVRVSAIGNVFYAVAPVTVSAIVLCDGSAPVGLAASGITSSSATLNWDAISGATYIVRYRLAGSSTWTEVPVSTNTYNITGLDESTQYEYQVAAVCSGTTGTYTTVANFTTLGLTYCPLASTNFADEYISNVTVGTMSSNSAGSTYTDYSSDSARTVNLVKGSTANSISVTMKWPGTSDWPETLSVWIDFNRDGAMDETERIVKDFTANPSSANIGQLVKSFTFDVPSTAYSGTKATKMRVALKYGTALTSAPYSSCNGNTTASPVSSTYTYGEVEDYAVMISPALAVSDNVKNQSIKVYPNPATDVLNVSKVSNKATYSIYNMAGQVVAKGNVNNNVVPVSSLEKGVYMISVDNNGEAAKVKFIKK